MAVYKSLVDRGWGWLSHQASFCNKLSCSRLDPWLYIIARSQEHDVGSFKAFWPGLGSHSKSILPHPMGHLTKDEG